MPSDAGPDDSFGESTPIDKSRSSLDNFLASRDISPIRSSLKTPWDDVGERSKRYYVKKASEAVAESLKVIAGEDSDKLWDTLVSSKGIYQHFPFTTSETEDVDTALLESLVECFFFFFNFYFAILHYLQYLHYTTYNTTFTYNIMKTLLTILTLHFLLTLLTMLQSLTI